MDVDYERLQSDAKAYLSTRFDIFKLNLLEKGGKIIGLILFAIALSLLCFVVIAFSGLALIYALGVHLPLWGATLIVVGLCVVFILLCIAFRKQLFINPMIASIAGILFSSSKDSDKSDKAEKEVSDE